MAKTAPVDRIKIEDKMYDLSDDGKKIKVGKEWIEIPSTTARRDRYDGATTQAGALTEIVKGFRDVHLGRMPKASSIPDVDSLQTRWQKFPRMKKGETGMIKRGDGTKMDEKTIAVLEVFAEKIIGQKAPSGKTFTHASKKTQPKDFDAWFGSTKYADDEKIKSQRAKTLDPKKQRELETELKKNESVPTGVELWKQNWLFRQNKGGKDITEKTASPPILWGVLERLSRGESFPDNLAKYYTRNPSDDMTEKLLRTGKYSKDDEGNEIPHTRKLAMIKADLLQLMYNDIKKGTAEESESKWYPKAKAIRGFLQANAISVPDQEPTSPLAQSVTDFAGKHAEIKLNAVEITKFLEKITHPIAEVEIKEPEIFSISIPFDTPNAENELKDAKQQFVIKYNKKQLFPHGVFSDAEVWNKDSMITKEIFDEVANATLDEFQDREQEGTGYEFKYKTFNFTLNKKFVTEPDDWKSAELLVRLCLELGCRAEEAFSLSAFPSRAGEAKQTPKGFEQASFSDTDAESGMVWHNELQKMQCTIITWKTHQMGAMGRISVQHILNKKTNALFRERQIKLMKEFDYDNNPTKIVSFIGKQDEYRTIKNFFKRTNTQTGEQRKNRERLNAVIRYTYQGIGKKWTEPTQAYFFSHPIHSWRHIMAQNYTKQTNEDYDWIAKRGHWNTLTVLRESYASLGMEMQVKKDIQYGELELGEVATPLTEAQKKLAESQDFDKQKQNYMIQNLDDPRLRKDNPVQAYFDLLEVQKHYPEYLSRKDVSPKIRQFMDNFKHREMEVEQFNARFEKEIKDKIVKKIEYVPAPELEEIESEDDLE